MLAVKTFMLHPKSKHLQNVLNTVASNLDIPLEVLPFLQHVWARRLEGGERQWRRSSRGGEAVAARELARLMLRCYLVLDPHRTATSGELGELGKMLRSRTITLQPAVASVLECKVATAHPTAPHAQPPRLPHTRPRRTRNHHAQLTPSPSLLVHVASQVFHYTRIGGGPLRLTFVDELCHAITLSGGDAASAAQAAHFLSELIGVVFSPRAGEHEGELRADPRTGEILGYARVPHGEPTPPYFSSTALRESLSEASLAQLQLLATGDGASKLVRCSWLGAGDPSLSFLRDALPTGCVIVSVWGRPLTDEESQRKWRTTLLAALREGEVCVAKPYSLLDAVKLAQAAAPKVHVSGLAGERHPSGAFASTPKRLAVPVEERTNLYRYTKPSAACRGEEQRLRLYLFHPGHMAATGEAAGGPRVRAAKDRGIDEQYASLAAAAARLQAAGTKAAEEAEHAALSKLMEQVGPTLLSAEDADAAADAPTAPRKDGVADKGLATAVQWGDYQSVLPRRMGTADPALAGGSNLELKAVGTFMAKMRGQHPAVQAACGVLYERRRLGDDGYDWSQLVADGGGDGGGGSGDDGDGDDGGAGIGDRQRRPPPTAAAAARAQKKGQLLAKGEVLLRAVEQVRQRMWAARDDLETFNELSKVRAALLTAVAANRAAMRRLRKEGARPATAAGAAREEEEGGQEEEEEGEEDAEDAAAQLVASLPAFLHDYEEDYDEDDDDDYEVGEDEESEWGEVGSEISADEAAEAASQHAVLSDD